MYIEFGVDLAYSKLTSKIYQMPQQLVGNKFHFENLWTVFETSVVFMHLINNYDVIKGQIHKPHDH